MECSSCGSFLGPGALFCGNCGARVVAATTAPAALPGAVIELVEPSSNPTVQLRPLVDRVPSEILEATTPPLSSFAPPVVDTLADDDGGADDDGATILAPRRATWRLVTSDGARHAIRTTTVVGRSPSRPVFAPDAELLGLLDPTRSMSKSHALLQLEGESLTVVDLGSTNGILILDADGDDIEVRAGRPITVTIGMRLELGEFAISFERD